MLTIVNMLEFLMIPLLEVSKNIHGRLADPPEAYPSGALAIKGPYQYYSDLNSWKFIEVCLFMVTSELLFENTSLEVASTRQM